MTTYLPFVLIGAVAAVLVLWSLSAQRGRNRARAKASRQLGLRPCPDEKAWLEETVARIENNRGFRYEVRDPQRWSREPAAYCYVKVRHPHAQVDAVSEEEILFPLKRPSTAGLILAVKPSSLAPGLATRVIGAVAAGPWDAQPDDLRRLELPPDLRSTNLVAALGPAGASLYELVDADTISVVHSLGDAGGLIVRFRDHWCTVAGAGTQIPFKLDALFARLRPLL